MVHDNKPSTNWRLIRPKLELRGKDISKEEEPQYKKNKRKCCFYIGLSVASVLFVASLIVASVMTFTDYYENMIYEKVVLKEGEIIFKLWKDPPSYTVVSVYVFNYTNVNNVLIGEEVPHVEQTGPYVFKEFKSKVNIVFNDDGTLTYQENRTHEFVPEMSNGTLDDIVTIPNFPLLAARSMKKGVIESSGISFLDIILSPKVFNKITVEELIWGYDDSFSLIARGVSSILKDNAPSKFGILAQRAGMSKDRITIGDGINDPRKLSIVHRYNGKDKIGVWDDPECDSIQGTDGALFPRYLLKPNSTIYIYSKDLCRRIPMTYKERTNVGDIPVNRFILPVNVFDPPPYNEENSCFCNNGLCERGVFRVDKCAFGAPVVITFPHFTFAEDYLHEYVTGLKPDPEKYTTFLDIHDFGVSLASGSKIQVNIQLDEASSVPYLRDIISDGTILPFAWIEQQVSPMSESLHDFIYFLTFTIWDIGCIINGTSIGLLIVTSAYLLFAFKFR